MNHKKQLLSLLSILSLVGSSDCLQASYQKYLPSMFKSKPTTQPAQKSPAKTQPAQKVIDLPEIMESYQKPHDLLDIHGQVIKQAQPRYFYSPISGISKKVAPLIVNNEAPLDFDDIAANVYSDDSQPDFQQKPVIQGTKVTPAAYLKSILSKENIRNYKDAFNLLSDDGDIFNKYLDDEDIYKNYNANTEKLVQQARTLLVRAHPELVPGLLQKLGYLPNRFMSYFKEKMPTLSTAAGKQRFTQSVIMETLKDMPEFDKKAFDTKLTEIANKYASNLNPTNTQMVAQWSRNLVTELALLAPRTAVITTGAAVGAGVGVANVAARAAVLGTASVAAGATTAGILGDYIVTGGKINQQVLQSAKNNLIKRTPDNTIMQMPDGSLKDAKNTLQQIDPKYFSRDVSSRSYPQAALDTVGGVAAGATAGALVAGTGLTATALVTPIATTYGAVQGGRLGAEFAGQFSNAASRAVGNRVQSAYNKLFTPKSNLTTANSRNSSGNLSSSEHTGSGASSDIFSSTSDGSTGTEYSNRVTSASPVGNSLPSFGQSNLTGAQLNSRRNVNQDGWNTYYDDAETASVN